MKKRIAVIGALVSLMPWGQSLLLGSTIALSTTTVVLSSQPALAQVVDEYLVIANSLLSKGIELNVKNQHLFKEIIQLLHLSHFL